MPAHSNVKYILLCALSCMLLLLVNYCYCQQWKQIEDSAITFKTQKDFDSSIVYYIKSRKLLLADSSVCDAYIKMSINLAQTYLSNNNYDDAEKVYADTKQLTEKLKGKDAVYVSICDRLGGLYATTGDYKSAENLFAESKSIKEKLFTKQSVQYAAACTFLANVCTATGQYEKAENLYREGKSIRENLLPQDSAGYAQVCNNLANLYRETGRYEEAEPLALNAKNIRAGLINGKDSAAAVIAYAISCTNLANLYRDMGQYEKAEALYVEAKNIRANIPPVKNNAAYASSCNILADLYYFMGKNDDAEMLYKEAKQIREIIFTKESNEYAQSCNNLANLYRETGNYKDAEALALEAQQTWNKLLDLNNATIADNLENLALIFSAEKKYSDAEAAFLQARKIREKVSDANDPALATNAFYLGELYWKLKQISKANFYFTVAFNAQYKQLKNIFQFTNEKEKEQYLSNVNNPVDEYESFYFSELNHDNAAASYLLSLSNRNLILSANAQLRKIISNSGDSSLIKKYDEWITLKNQLSVLYVKNDAATTEKISVIEQKANDLEKDLFRNSTAVKSILSNNVTWQTIQQNLKPNEAAIEFSNFNFYNGFKWSDSVYYVAVILRKDKPQPQLVFLFKEDELNAALNNRDDINALYSNNTSLYNLMWKPAEKYLAGIRKIYFAPAGELFKISFAALPINDHEVLSDKYILSQLNTTSSVTENKNDLIQSSGKIQLYGGIEYAVDTAALKHIASAYHTETNISRSLPDDLTRSGSIQYLPATETEIESIEQMADQKQMNVTIFTGINATEESFEALNGNASPAILHIATHGFFFPDPKEDKRDSIQKKFETSGKAFRQSSNPLLRAGLLFAGANNAWQGKGINGIDDGIVTAYDVSNMYLPNTKLVVLSACETALGDIKGSEGVYGLQRAFKIAGVQNLVMSLWKVPDAETSEFMQLFYANVFKNMSVSDAFRAAQTTMKNKYRNEPYKWAAWVLIK